MKKIKILTLDKDIGNYGPYATLLMSLLMLNNAFNDLNINNSLLYYTKITTIYNEIKSFINEDDIIILHTGLLGRAFNYKDIFDKLNCKFIIYNSESVYEERWKWHKQIINHSKLFMIWDYEYENINYLKLSFNNCFFVPPSYNVLLENMIPKNNNKDIDILFFGGINFRRKQIRNKLRASTKDLKIHFRQFENWNEQKPYIARAKIVIVVHFYEEDMPIDYYRINSLIANKIFIIHEDVQDIEKSQELYKELIISKYENISNTCIEWLNKTQEERDNHCNKLYDFFKNKCSLTNFIPKQLLDIK